MSNRFLSRTKQVIYNGGRIAVLEWKSMFYSTKLLILGMMFIFLNIQIIEPIVECSRLMECKVSFFEPFVALANSSEVVLVLPLLFLTMMADFPKHGGITTFVHIRCDRLTWVIGEMMFVVMSSVTILGGLMVVSGLLLFGNGTFSLSFSDAVTKYVSRFPEKCFDYVVSLFPENLYNQMQLTEAVLHSLALMFLYFTLLALLLLLFTILNKKIAGVLTTVLVIVLGAILNLTETFQWLFPTAHTLTWLHFSPVFAKQIYPIAYSYLYFGIADSALLLACVLLRKKYQYR